VEKLRKIARQLWLAKERIVLAVMVVAFAWQVYKVQNPPETVEEEPVTIPRVVQQEDMPLLGVPVPPPNLPPPPALADYRALARSNMFWYFSGQSAATESVEEAPTLTLTSIMAWPDGTYRAQIKTASSEQWIGKGEDFEDYTLMSIDEAAGTVEVYDAKRNQTVVLELQ
jgi:hypothetical protein